MKKTILVDFDGVLHAYTSRWVDAYTIPDPPVPGALEWLALAVQQPGWTVAIYSSRSRTARGRAAMRAWLIREGLAVALADRIEFPAQKPPAWLTLDDRCIRFEGVFPSVAEVNDFRPWNKP